MTGFGVVGIVVRLPPSEDGTLVTGFGVVGLGVRLPSSEDGPLILSAVMHVS